MLCKLCGEPALRNVVLVTNMWGRPPHSIDETRERVFSSNFFRPALDKRAQMFRHHNTVQSAHDIVRRIVENYPVALLIQRELVDERKDIVDTTAGKAINRELHERLGRHQAKLEGVLAGKESMRVLQEQMGDIVRDWEGISPNYAAEKERMEAKMKELKRRAQKRKQNQTDHSHRLRDETDVAGRAKSKQQTHVALYV